MDTMETVYKTSVKSVVQHILIRQRKEKEKSQQGISIFGYSKS